MHPAQGARGGRRSRLARRVDPRAAYSSYYEHSQRLLVTKVLFSRPTHRPRSWAAPAGLNWHARHGWHGWHDGGTPLVFQPGSMSTEGTFQDNDHVRGRSHRRSTSTMSGWLFVFGDPGLRASTSRGIAEVRPLSVSPLTWRGGLAFHSSQTAPSCHSPGQVRQPGLRQPRTTRIRSRIRRRSRFAC